LFHGESRMNHAQRRDTKARYKGELLTLRSKRLKLSCHQKGKVKSSQVKSSQVKSSQVRSSQGQRIHARCITQVTIDSDEWPHRHAGHAHRPPFAPVPQPQKRAPHTAGRPRWPADTLDRAVVSTCMQSDAILPDTLDQRSSEVIRGHQRSSEVIRACLPDTLDRAARGVALLGGARHAPRLLHLWNSEWAPW
jgi:hypothetical protein